MTVFKFIKLAVMSLPQKFIEMAIDFRSYSTILVGYEYFFDS